MNILVFNVGSSSVKYCYYEGDDCVDDEYYEDVDSDERLTIVEDVIESHDSVDAVGHRVVHGKDFKEPKRIDPALLETLHGYEKYAPLHQPPELEGVEKCMEKGIPSVAVFDTSFHQSMPKKAKMYGLPRRFYEEGFRRYGFHGISHEYVTKDISGKTVSCHLGSGCSLAAVEDGSCYDTTMGFTPLEGLVMSTRSGDVDPGLIFYLLDEEGYSVDELNDIFNNESGWKGLSGVGKDLRDVLASDSNHAEEAVDVFCYNVSKKILSMTAALNGLNNIVFTAGVGERNNYLRKRILDPIEHLGIDIDTGKNESNNRVISTDSSNVDVYIIPTDEEKMIAEKTRDVIG